MSFAYPWVLALLVIPAGMLIWSWRHERGRVALPFDHSPARRGRRWKFPLDLASSLPALLLGIVVCILAGPQRLSEPKAERIMTNIEFCVDVSGSMSSALGDGTRYDASMTAINKFLDYRKGDSFGLTFFGSGVLHWVPLTRDISAFKHAPPFMKPEVVPPWMGGTEIGRALKACQKVLTSREEGDRMIVLISDGYSFDLGNGMDAEIANSLKKDNIVCYAIHIESTQPPDEIVDVTRMTGGEVFPVDDPSALTEVFKQIDTMKTTKVKQLSPETIDYYRPFCIAGLSILGTSVLTLLGLRYTPW